MPTGKVILRPFGSPARQRRTLTGRKSIRSKKSGQGRIRTYGALRHFGFQDRSIKPLSHLPYCYEVLSESVKERN